MSEHYLAGGKPTMGHCATCGYAQPTHDGCFRCHFSPPPVTNDERKDVAYVAPKVTPDNCCSKWIHADRLSWIYDQAGRASIERANADARDAELWRQHLAQCRAEDGRK